MFRVKVDFCPAYELATSLSAVLNRKVQRLLEIGKAWPSRMRRRMSPQLSGLLEASEAAGDQGDIVYVLIYLCPEDRSVEGFLGWMGGLSPGSIYELVAPYVPEDRPLSRDLGGLRDRVGEILSLWNQEYFSRVDPGIISLLETSAREWTARAAAGEPGAVVEAASGGVVIDPDASLKTVLLVPQYHARPWNTYSVFKDLLINFCPAEVPPAAKDDPSPSALRFAQALSDPNRLRILRHLAEGPLGFMEIVRLLRQPKSTVHYHMVALRAAGLVRVYTNLAAFKGSGAGGAASLVAGSRYGLRESALADQWARLYAYLLRKGDDNE